MLYLLSLTIGLCVAYLACFWLFPMFFTGASQRISSRSIRSVVLIIGMNVTSYLIAFSIPDAEWSNRILHAVGGGLLGMIVCYLAARDARVSIRAFQFFTFSFGTVLVLGVGNEIIEYFLQNYTQYFQFAFAATFNDTWLDLISNVAGASLGVIVLAPWVLRKNADEKNLKM